MNKMNRYKPVGWRNDSHRHYLAAKGIKTKNRATLQKWKLQNPDEIFVEKKTGRIVAAVGKEFGESIPDEQLKKLNVVRVSKKNQHKFFLKKGDPSHVGKKTADEFFATKKIKGHPSHKEKVIEKIGMNTFFEQDGEVFQVMNEDLGKKSAQGSLKPSRVEGVFIEEGGFENVSGFEGPRAFVVTSEFKNGKLGGVGVSQDIEEFGNSHKDLERGKRVSAKEGVKIAKNIFEGTHGEKTDEEGFNKESRMKKL